MLTQKIKDCYETTKNVVLPVIDHITANNRWYVLAIAGIVFISSLSYHVYEQGFDKKALLIAESVSLQREKLESESELKDLQRRIATYNSMAEEHNARAKEVSEKLKEFNKEKVETTGSFVGNSIIIFFLTLVLVFGGKRAHEYHTERMEWDREYRKKVRKYSFGLLYP